MKKNKLGSDTLKICFIIAMSGEAEGIKKHYNLELAPDVFDPFIPMQAYCGENNGVEITLIINGKDSRHKVDNIATQPAVLTSYLAIKHFNPDLIINAGTAGGFKEKGLKIGDVVVAQGSAFFHDRRIPIPIFNEYGLGAYALEDRSKLIDHLGLKAGIISTGNAFDFNEDDKRIMDDVGASIKDMEAAAIAWVAELAKTPLIIIKSVTDFVDLENKNEKEFVQNFHVAVNALTNSCIDLVAYFSK